MPAVVVWHRERRRWTILLRPQLGQAGVAAGRAGRRQGAWLDSHFRFLPAWKHRLIPSTRRFESISAGLRGPRRTTFYRKCFAQWSKNVDVTFPLLAGPQKAGALFDMSCLISNAMNCVNWVRIKLLSDTSMTERNGNETI